MGAVNARMVWTTDELLAAVKRLPLTELGEFERRLSVWRGQTNGADPVPPADADEATLLARIREYSSLPRPEQHRFNRLRRKQQAERLSQSETIELHALWQRVEQMNVERLCSLCMLG